MAKFSTGSEVRAWAQTATLPEGVSTPGLTRGRLAKGVTEAFNAEHPRAKYVPASKAPAETVIVKVRPESGKGRSVAKRVNVAQARAHAVSTGTEVGARGRLSKAVLTAYARTL